MNDVIPEPIPILQLLAAISTIGSFGLAVMNWMAGAESSRGQEVVASGDSPHRVIQIMDSEVELGYPVAGEAAETDSEPRDTQPRDEG